MFGKIALSAAVASAGYFAATIRAAKMRHSLHEEAKAKASERKESDWKKWMDNLWGQQELREALKVARQEGYDDGFNTATEEGKAREKLLGDSFRAELKSALEEAEKDWVAQQNELVKKHKAELDQTKATAYKNGYEDARKENKADQKTAADVTKDLAKLHEKKLAEARAEAYNKGREDALKYESAVEAANENLSASKES